MAPNPFNPLTVVRFDLDRAADVTLAVYDVLGFLIEDLIKEGFCAACVNETIAAALERTGQDLTNHREGDEEVPLRGPGDVFH